MLKRITKAYRLQLWWYRALIPVGAEKMIVIEEERQGFRVAGEEMCYLRRHKDKLGILCWRQACLLPLSLWINKIVRRVWQSIVWICKSAWLQRMGWVKKKIEKDKSLLWWGAASLLYVWPTLLRNTPHFRHSPDKSRSTIWLIKRAFSRKFIADSFQTGRAGNGASVPFSRAHSFHLLLHQTFTLSSQHFSADFSSWNTLTNI